MPVTAITSDQLKDIDWEGLIHEDVLDAIFDVSPETNAFIDLIGAGTCDNTYFSWVTDALEKPSAATWAVEGADTVPADTKSGARLGNHIGIMEQSWSVSDTADATDTIGYSTEMMYQENKQMKELRRMENYNLLANQGSTEADKATDTAGVPAGFGAMCRKYDNGSGGSGGDFSTGMWTGWTAGTKTALTETHVRDAAQAAWLEGGNPGYMLTDPSITRAFSEYLFTSSARIATSVDNGSMGASPRQGVGTMNVFLSDFGSELRLTPDRWMPRYQSSGGSAGDAAMVFLIDPNYVEVARLRGYQSEPIAKLGLSNRRMISVQTSLRLLNQDACIAIPDVDHAAPVTQA